MNQEAVQVELSGDESMENESSESGDEDADIHAKSYQSDSNLNQDPVNVELNIDKNMEDESSESEIDTKSHQGNTSRDLKTMNLEDIPPINSDPDIDTPINARIVKLETGKL